MLINSSQMRLPSPGSVAVTSEGERKNLNSELWHACAGPLVSLPAIGSRVVYLPQGHSEQVAASTQKEVDAQIPAYPNLPPQLVCQLHDVILHADLETDEVYCQMTLQPVTPDSYFVPDPGTPNRQPNIFFCKTLTASDTSTHGGFSIPRRAAEKVFPPLDYNQQPPAQELVARDLHDNEWKFRHIYRGQPKRHLLTTGWSVFVSTKRLVAGDSVLFIRNDKGQLLLGIRRATRPQTVLPSSVLSSDSMHIGVLAAAAHASNTNSRFTVFYNPRASPSEFVIPFSKFEKAVYQSRVSVGMRFRMLFETEESSVRRYMGTITGIGDLDPVRWPNSQWRSIKVGWDESTAGERQRRVSLWEIEPLTTFLVYPPTSNWRLRNPWSQPLIGAPFMHDMDFESSKKPSTWMQFQNGANGYAGLATQGAAAAMNPMLGAMQWRFDTSIESDVYDSLGAAALQEISPSKQLQFQQPKPQPDQLLYRAQAQMQQQTPYLYPPVPRQLQPQPAQAQIVPQMLAPPQPLLLQGNPQMPLQSHQQQPPHLQQAGQPLLQQPNQPQLQQSSQLHEQPLQRQPQQVQASTPMPHPQQQEQNQQPSQQQVLLQHQQHAPQLLQLQQQQQQQLQHPPQAQQPQQHQQQLHPHSQPQLHPKQEQYNHQYQKQMQPQQQQQHPQQPQNQLQQQQQQPHQHQPPPPQQPLPPLQQQQRHVQTHLPHYPSAVPSATTSSLTSPSVPLQQQKHNSPLLQPTQQQGSASSHLSTQQQQQGVLHYPVLQQPQVELSSTGQPHQLQSFVSAPSLVNSASRLPSSQQHTILPSPQSTLLEASGMLSSTVAPNTFQTIFNNFAADTSAPLPNSMPTILPSIQPSTLILGSELQSDCSVPSSWVSTLTPLSSAPATELIEATRPLGELCVGSNTDSAVMPSFSTSGLPSNSCAYREFSQGQDELPSDLYRQAQFGANVDLQAMVMPTSMPPPDSRSYSGSNELQCMSPFLQGQSSMMGMDISPNASLFNGGLDDPRLLQAWAQANTPVRTYTKVYKSGSVGRSLDVMRFSNYPELRHELGRMFGLEGQLDDPSSGWQLIFVDRENDWLLLGDDPWEVFINNVRSIRILSPSEVFQMQDGVGLQTSYSIQRQTSCSSEDGTTQQESRNPSSVITSTCSLEY